MRTEQVRVTDADFESALSEGVGGRMDIETAQTLFSGASQRDKMLRLFSAASEIRDRNLGRKLIVSAHIHMVTTCELPTSCLYCSLSSSYPSVSNERAKLNRRELVRAVAYSLERGVQSIVLVGGTNLGGSDSEVREIVERIGQVSDVDLALDVGPSLSEGTVKWLKSRNVSTIYYSVETINRRAFAKAKPDDSLDKRIECMEALERNGVKLGSIVMNGLGSNADLLTSILYLRRFKRNLSHLYVSTFQPVRGTPWASRAPGSVRASLKALAIARLMFPKTHIGLAEVEVEDPGSLARASSQLAAGGGNSLAGLLIYKKKRVDNIGPISREASSLGFKVQNLLLDRLEAQ